MRVPTGGEDLAWVLGFLTDYGPDEAAVCVADLQRELRRLLNEPSDGIPERDPLHARAPFLFESGGRRYEQHFLFLPTMQLFQSFHWPVDATVTQKRDALQVALLSLSQRVWRTGQMPHVRQGGVDP